MSAPPSYDSIVYKLNNLVGPNPTPRKVLDAAGTLNRTEIEVLANHASPQPPPLTPNEKSTFTVGLAKEMKSVEANGYLKQAADTAAAASTNIKNLFTQLTADLSAIDSQNAPPAEGPFGPRLNAFHQRFNQTVSESKTLAVKIAVYARRFDQIIIPVCNNPNYSVQQRLEKINEFIADADAFAKEADAMRSSFDDLKGQFALFVGSFSGWAKDKEAADTAQLKQARLDLEDLQRRLAALQVALAAVGGVTALTLPVTGVVAMLSGPFAPFVILGGVIAAALGFGAIVGVAVSLQLTKGEIEDKQAEIKALTASIEKIKATRESLTQIGDTSLAIFSDNVDVLSHVWQTAKNDAIAIKTWLEGGAKDVDMPEYMLISVEYAINIYMSMADYLDRYANGV